MANQARAVEDLVQTPIESSVIFNSDVACGTYLYGKYYARENGGTRDSNGTKVTPNGTIGRDASVTWVDISMGLPETKSNNVTAKVTHDKLKSAIDSNPSKYPKLSSALNSITITGAFTIDNIKFFGVGSVRQISSTQYFVVDSIVHVEYPSQISWCNWSAGPIATTYLSTSCYYVAASGSTLNGSFYDGITKYITGHFVSSLPSPVSVPPSQFAQNLAKSSSAITAPVDVYSDYYGEIDDFIKDNPNVMEYVDTEDSSQVDTAPDFVGPLGNCRDLANANAAQYMKPSCLNVQ